MTCKVSLPEDYDTYDIYCCIVIDDIEIAAESVQAKQAGHITARFNCSDIDDLLEPGDVEITVFCQTSDGTWFMGTDTIAVVDKGNN